MRSKVQRWGNSLAVRIPKSFAADLGLSADSPVEIRVVEGQLLLEPATATIPRLDELLAGVTESNLQEEVDTGPPQGAEAW